jgi:phenylacetate-CoA ligase
MLIVRGVNVFPTAIRDVVGAFSPRVSGQSRPAARGRRQAGAATSGGRRARRRAAADPDFAEEIRARLREVLVVQTHVEPVPWGSLARSEYKSALVDR